MTTVFSGKKFAGKLEKKIAQDFSSLSPELKKLSLVDILVGDNEAAQTYLKLKERAAQRVGIKFWPVELSERVGSEELRDLVKQLNQNEEVGGIMFQLPLPERLRINQQEIVDQIIPSKDVDCLTSHRLSRVLSGKSSFLPATVEAVIRIMEEAGIGERQLSGKKIAVIGRSNIVGRPLAAFLQKKGALVTVCHRQTRTLSNYTQSAEIIVSATGQPKLIKKDMVSFGQVVIDIGSPEGDVDFLQVKDRVSFITPVPGGVGPVTVASLLGNFVRLLKENKKKKSY